MSRWIRLDVGFDDTEWVFSLSAESQLAWVKLLCYVKRDGASGKVKAMSTVVAAKRWGVGTENVEKMLFAAKQDGALTEVDGEWVINGWDEYQNPDPTSPERQRRYRDRKFKRTEVFVRDNHTCQICGTTSGEMVVDHIIPVSHGGDTVIDNLQCLCRSCNASKRDSVTTVTRNKTVTCTRDIDSDIDRDNDSVKSGRFIKPKLDTLTAFGESIGLPKSECVKLHDYYESKGWMVGKSPMKNWHSAVRNWHRRWKESLPDSQVNYGGVRL